MKIESTDQDVRNLLSSGYYRIPRFQRPYSWTSENVKDFWEDVTNNPGDNYFIGSMVMFKDGNQRYGVVDGQQRLTTITILLAALRDKLKEIGLTDLATGIQNQIEKKNIDNKPEYILSTETSYPFFQDRILKFESPEVEKHGTNEEDSLRVAYDFFNEKLSELIEQADLLKPLAPSERKEHLQPKLVAIRDAVLGLKVILVKLDSEDDAYIIFETLNTRGKDLNLSTAIPQEKKESGWKSELNLSHDRS